MPSAIRIVSLVMALLASGLIIACGQPPGSGAPGDASPVASPTGAANASPTPVASLSELTTLGWRLTELDGSPTPDEALVVLDLGQSVNRFLSGLIGCWGYSATLDRGQPGLPLEATSTGERVTLYPRDCPDPAARPSLVDAYVAAPSGAASWTATDGRLEIAGADGATRMVYEPFPQAPLDTALTGRTWALRSLRGADPLPGVTLTLQIDDHGVTGNDGCNWYGGSAVVTGDGLLRLPWPGYTGTVMGCADDIMAQAEAYTGTLLAADGYRLADGALEILDRTGEPLLVFTERGMQDLAAVTWRVGTIKRPDERGDIAGFAVIEGTEISLAFDGTTGRLSGSTGCNGYGAPFEIDGVTIRIGDVLHELKLCLDPPGVMEQEQHFVDLLRHVTTWELDGTRLRLTADDGRMLELWPEGR